LKPIFYPDFPVNYPPSQGREHIFDSTDFTFLSEVPSSHRRGMPLREPKG